MTHSKADSLMHQGQVFEDESDLQEVYDIWALLNSHYLNLLVDILHSDRCLTFHGFSQNTYKANPSSLEVLQIL
jgi:hypothetical protein